MFSSLSLLPFTLSLSLGVSSLLPTPQSFEPISQTLPILSEAQVTAEVEAAELLEQGTTAMEQGDLETAIARIEAALVLYQGYSDTGFPGTELQIQITAGLLWSLYNQLGWQQMDAFALDDALATYERQREIAHLTQAPRYVASNLLNLGNVYLQLEQWQTAREYVTEGLSQSQTLGEESLIERGWGLLLAVETGLGNWEAAIAAAENLQAVASNSTTRFQSLQGLGASYFYIGDYDRALDYHQQSLQVAENERDLYFRTVALASVGETQAALGEIDKAIATLSQGLALAQDIDPVLSGVVKGTLGKVYVMAGELEQGIPLLQASAQQEAQVGSGYGEAIARTNLGNAYFLAENLTAAETELRQAIALWEQQRQDVTAPQLAVSLFDTQLVTYRTLQQVLIAQGKAEAALVVAEQGRSQVLRQQLATTEPGATGSAITLAEIKAIARSQNATLVEYSLVPKNEETFMPNRVDNRWLNTTTDLYIWVVKPSGEVFLEEVPLTGEEESVADLVEFTREAIGARGIGADASPELKPGVEEDREAAMNEKLRRLHGLLIEPIAEYLPTDPEARVVFVPQEFLFLVPFPALRDQQGTYLIERHTILTAPSIQTLQLTRQAKERLQAIGGQALLVGNPTMPTVTLPDGDGGVETFQLNPLNGAQIEVEEIARLLEMPALIGAAATEKAVKQQIADVGLIHLATHGLLDYVGSTPEESLDAPGAIALAPGSGEDGLLTAGEIAELRLQASLVVLSACDTGRGRITGDGVIGLSRSFIAAGVPSVVVSLWQVPDDSTAKLMMEFYRQRQQTGDSAKALRLAMLATMKEPDHSKPQQWAAFTLIGEAD